MRTMTEWKSSGCEAQFATTHGSYGLNFRDVSNIRSFFNMITITGPVQGSEEPSSALIISAPSGETFDNVIEALNTIKAACPDTL